MAHRFDPNTYYWDWWESGVHERSPVMPLRDLVKQTPLAAGQQGDYVGWLVLGVDEQMEDEESRQRVGTFFYGNKAAGEVRKGNYWMDWPEDESQRSWKRYVTLPIRERAEMEMREQLGWGLKKSFDLLGRERNPRQQWHTFTMDHYEQPHASYEDAVFWAQCSHDTKERPKRMGKGLYQVKRTYIGTTEAIKLHRFEFDLKERNPYDAYAAGWRWLTKFVVYGPTGRVLGTVYGRDVADALDNLRPHIRRLGLAAAHKAHLRPWASSRPEERAAASPQYGGIEIGKPDRQEA